MKNRKREICTSGSVRDEDWQHPHLLGEVRPETGVFSRRQACRGKSQAPCSLDSRVAGNQNPEAYRQGLPWETTSYRAVTTVNANVASKGQIRGPSLLP